MAALYIIAGRTGVIKKTDRARAAYDNFIELDGKFDDNVILQIKNGPMVFRCASRFSPLFGGLKV